MKEKIDPGYGCAGPALLRKVRASEAAHHFRNARREVLLAIKSVVEAGIEKIDAHEKAAQEHKGEARKVEVT